MGFFGPGSMSGFATRFNELQDRRDTNRATRAKERAKALQDKQKEAIRLEEQTYKRTRNAVKDFQKNYPFEVIQNMPPSMQQELHKEYTKIHLMTGVSFEQARRNSNAWFGTALGIKQSKAKQDKIKTDKQNLTKYFREVYKGNETPINISLLYKHALEPSKDVRSKVDSFTSKEQAKINKFKANRSRLILNMLKNPQDMLEFGGSNNLLSTYTKRFEEKRRAKVVATNKSDGVRDLTGIAGLSSNLAEQIKVNEKTFELIATGSINPADFGTFPSKQQLSERKGLFYQDFFSTINDKLDDIDFLNDVSDNKSFKRFLNTQLDNWHTSQDTDVPTPEGTRKPASREKLLNHFSNIKTFLGDKTTDPKSLDVLTKDNDGLPVAIGTNNIKNNLQVQLKHAQENMPPQLNNFKVKPEDINTPENVENYKNLVGNTFQKSPLAHSFWMSYSPKAISKLKSQPMQTWFKNNLDHSFTKSANLALALNRYNSNITFRHKTDSEQDLGATPANTKKLFNSIIRNIDGTNNFNSRSEALNNALDTLINFRVINSRLLDDRISKATGIDQTFTPNTHKFDKFGDKHKSNQKEIDKIQKNISNNKTLLDLVTEVLTLTRDENSVEASENISNYFKQGGLNLGLDTFNVSPRRANIIGREGEFIVSLNAAASYLTGTVGAFMKFLSFDDNTKNKLESQLNATRKAYTEDTGKTATIYSTIANGKAYRTNLNAGNQTLLQQLDTRVRTLNENLSKRQNDPVFQKAALIEMNKIALTYRLSGIVQGDSTGGRTISNQDFDVMYKAIWGSSGVASTKRLQLLFSRITNDVHKLDAQKRFRLEGGFNMLQEFGHESSAIKPLSKMVDLHYINEFDITNKNFVHSDRQGAGLGSTRDADVPETLTNIIYKEILKSSKGIQYTTNQQGLKEDFVTAQKKAGNPLYSQLFDLVETISYLKYIPDLPKSQVFSNILESENLTSEKFNNMSTSDQNNLFRKYSPREAYLNRYIKGNVVDSVDLLMDESITNVAKRRQEAIKSFNSKDNKIKIIENFIEDLNTSMLNPQSGKSNLNDKTKNAIVQALLAFQKSVMNEFPDLDDDTLSSRSLKRRNPDGTETILPRARSMEVGTQQFAPVEEMSEDDIPRDLGGLPDSIVDNSKVTNDSAFEYITSNTQEGSYFTNPELDASKKGNIIGYSMMINTLDPTEKELLGGDLKDVTQQQAASAAKYRISTIAQKYKQVIPNFNNIDQSIKNGLISAMYQIGPSFISKFPKMIAALKEGKFDEAAWHYLNNVDEDTNEIYSTIVAKQTPERAKEIANSIGNPETFKPNITQQGGL